MTTITFLQAVGVAMIPSLVWGWVFVSRNPQSLQIVVVTFLLGTLAVVPMLLFMAGLGVQLEDHELSAAMHGSDAGSMRQALSLVAFLGGVVIVLVGVIKLFGLISRRVTRHALRLGALVAAAFLLLAATLSHDQLREYFGAAGPPIADLFHVLVLFALFMFVLERLSSRTVANATISALAATLVLVVVKSGPGLAPDDDLGLSSISTIFSLPFLLEFAGQDGLTLRILNFMQVYLTFAVMAMSTLLVVAMVHMIYLLHENRWVKVLHGASLTFFALPFLGWAMSTVNPGVPLIESMRHGTPAVEAAWYANLALLAVLCAWSVVSFVRESGAAALALFNGLYEEPLNFLGVGLFLTVFVAVFHWFGLSVMTFSLIFLAFAEEYSKHLIARFTDDDSIRSINDAIEFSVIVGLAFAFAENVLLYFPRLLEAGNTPGLMLRGVLTVLMHAVASGILGYFYGLAHFSVEEVRRGHAGRGRLYRLLHRVFLFGRERLYHEVKMFQGLVLAGAYHAVFNIAASQGRIAVMLALVGGGCTFLHWLFSLKANRELVGTISERRVHATFVDRLQHRPSQGASAEGTSA